jgi:hypothetical protein
MRALRSAMTLMMAVALLGSTSLAAIASTEDDDPERILFVGNSLTYVEDIPTQVANLAASADPPEVVEVEQSVAPGRTLRGHLLSGTPRDIEGGSFDIVVLQGDIPENYPRNTDSFIEAATALFDVAKESGARTVLYMAWPYTRLDWIDLDGIVAAHRQLEADLGPRVAPVGLAFANASDERPELEMLAADAEHQSRYGAYLAAVTLFATLFERSPEGLPYRPDTMSEEEAAVLQRIAWEAVHEWNEGSSVE